MPESSTVDYLTGEVINKLVEHNRRLLDAVARLVVVTEMQQARIDALENAGSEVRRGRRIARREQGNGE